MRCTVCSTDNPEQAAFCMRCGTKPAKSCPDLREATVRDAFSKATGRMVQPAAAGN